MKRLPKGKTAIYAYIDKDLAEQFRVAVALSFGSYRKGNLSKALEEAIVLWLERHTQTWTAKHNLNALLREVGGATKRRLIAIANQLAGFGEEISEGALRRLIASVVGKNGGNIDQRTYQRYLRMLINYGVIEPKTMVRGKVIFEIRIKAPLTEGVT